MAVIMSDVLGTPSASSEFQRTPQSSKLMIQHGANQIFAQGIVGAC